jgi:hypothetical protein
LMLLPDLENHLSLYLSVHVPRLVYLKHAKSSKSPFLTFILILQNLTKLLQNLPMMFFAILLFNYQAANSEHHVRWIPPNPTKFLEIEPKKSTNHQKTKPFQVGHHIPLISLWYTMIYHIYIFLHHGISPFAQDRLRGVEDLGHFSGAPRHERVAFATAEGDPRLSQQPGRDGQLIPSGNLTFHIAIENTPFINHF